MTEIVTFLLFVGGSLGVGIGLHYILMEKNKLLPQDQKYMTEGRIACYWLLCFCCSFVAALVAYVVLSSEMDRRLYQINQHLDQPPFGVRDVTRDAEHS